MDARTDFDWRTSSLDDRKQLHAVSKSLINTTGLTWDQFFRATLGQTFGDDYEDNFRAGRIARKHCTKIHNWLRLSHPQFAADLDRALAAPVAVAPLPQRAIRNIGNYLGDKLLLYSGHRPAMRKVDAAEVTQVLRKYFFREQGDRTHVLKSVSRFRLKD